jgi:hypothetical protein
MTSLPLTAEISPSLEDVKRFSMYHLVGMGDLSGEVLILYGDGRLREEGETDPILGDF